MTEIDHIKTFSLADLTDSGLAGHKIAVNNNAPLDVLVQLCSQLVHNIGVLEKKFETLIAKNQTNSDLDDNLFENALEPLTRKLERIEQKILTYQPQDRAERKLHLSALLDVYSV